MLSLRVFSVAAFAVAAVATVVDAGKVICYYDGWSYHREGNFHPFVILNRLTALPC